uniref:Uncharacterized protein n=2 Tax=Caenorhabditis japonica TaxID=281687 RepID=A0A8R1HFR9_CAEJA
MIIPVMRTSTNKEKEATNSENPVENRENDVKMMESEASVYEIDELNSTIAPSSSRQCIVGADLECAPAVKIKKPKRKPMQRTEFHPQPPFSCVPIYTAILLGLLIVLIVGAVTTIVNMRPAFIYGKGDNSTVISFQEIEFSTLKPQ